jgi:DNA repair ATPase RecN
LLEKLKKRLEKVEELKKKHQQELRNINRFKQIMQQNEAILRRDEVGKNL